MKKQINEIKRMQLIAGLITESEYQESLMNEWEIDKTLRKTLINPNNVDDYGIYDADSNTFEIELETDNEADFMKSIYIPGPRDPKNYWENKNAYLALGVRFEQAVTKAAKIKYGRDVKITWRKSNRVTPNNISSVNKQMSEEEVLNILNQNGVDDDYFESMGGKEIESGTEEWMGILTDLTGKDAFEADFDDVDNQKIMSFIKKLKEMGIELV